MAVYKVIQDIEAEDKLIGPLTFKGLVYAGIAVLCGFINYKLLFASFLGPAKWLFIIILLMPMALFGVLASPLGREQPTEVWLLSRVRFFLKPRLRIWDQSGLKELVTITVPKRIIKQLTNNLTQSEVKSRLEALATTLDSRGWAVKNINVNLTTAPNYFDAQDESDRLVSSGDVATEVPVIDVHASDDIMDEGSNPTAQKFQSMMVEAERQRKLAVQQRIEKAKIEAAEAAKAQAEAEARAKAAAEASPPAQATTTQSAQVPTTQSVQSETEATEVEISHGHPEKIHDLKQIYEIHRPALNRVTDPAQTGKLELAQSGNDLSVASIAKLANRAAA
jgi:hypothetical protein